MNLISCAYFVNRIVQFVPSFNLITIWALKDLDCITLDVLLTIFIAVWVSQAGLLSAIVNLFFVGTLKFFHFDLRMRGKLRMRQHQLDICSSVRFVDNKVKTAVHIILWSKISRSKVYFFIFISVFSSFPIFFSASLVVRKNFFLD